MLCRNICARRKVALAKAAKAKKSLSVVVLNGNAGVETLHFELEAGSTFQLHASASYDPNPNDSITFEWYQYVDPSATQWSAEFEVGHLEIKPLDEAESVIEITIPPPEKCCLELLSREALPKGQILHLISKSKTMGLLR